MIYHDSIKLGFWGNLIGYKPSSLVGFFDFGGQWLRPK